MENMSTKAIVVHDFTTVSQEPAASLLARVLATSLLESRELKEATVNLLGLLVTPEVARALGPEDPLPLKPGAN